MEITITNQLEHDMTTAIALSLVCYGFLRASWGVRVGHENPSVVIHGCLFVAFGLALCRIFT